MFLPFSTKPKVFALRKQIWQTLRKICAGLTFFSRPCSICFYAKNIKQIIFFPTQVCLFVLILKKPYWLDLQRGKNTWHWTEKKTRDPKLITIQEEQQKDTQERDKNSWMFSEK